MVVKLLFLTIFMLSLFHIQPTNCNLSSCKHYLNEHDTPSPLDTCTTRSINQNVTSSKIICDSQSQSLLHRTFYGADCSPSNIQSEDLWNSDKYNDLVCEGHDCAVLLRQYYNNCNDFTDFAFIRGVTYKQQTECIKYDCSSEDGLQQIDITKVECESHAAYIQTTDDSDITPLYCGLYAVYHDISNMDNASMTIHGDGISTAQHDTRVYILPAIPIASVCFAVIIVVFVGAIHFFYFDDDEEIQIEPILKSFVIFSIGCNILGILCIMTVCVMMQTMSWNTSTYKMVIIPYIGSVIGYVGGKFCLESFFLLRVYLAFQGSVFRIQKRTCIVLYIWMIIISLMWLVIFIVDDKRLHFGYIVIWAFESIFIITLLCIFTNGLQRLLIHSSLERSAVISKSYKRKVSVSNQSNVSQSSDTSHITCASNVPRSVTIPASIKENVILDGLEHVSSESALSRWKYICCMQCKNVRSTKLNISAERLPLIYLMTRCILLSSISLITTAVFGIFLSIQASIDVESIYILYAIWSIDITINSCCLFLNFTFTDVVYKKCCILCHRSCQNMLEYVSASHVVHNAAVASLGDLKKVMT